MRGLVACLLAAVAFAEEEVCASGGCLANQGDSDVDGETSSLAQLRARMKLSKEPSVPCSSIDTTEPFCCWWPEKFKCYTCERCTAGWGSCSNENNPHRCPGSGPSQTKCFHVDLEADLVAVPDISTTASGSATIMVTADAVTVTSISWTELSSPVIGLHIHEGDHSQNGGILVGFCGSSPLPPFSGTCPNAESTTAGYSLPVSGQGCDLGEGACVGAKGTTLATIQGAAAEILSSTAPSQDLYLNLHTVSSFYMNAVSGANPLGLIRGQLVAMSC